MPRSTPTPAASPGAASPKSVIQKRSTAKPIPVMAHFTISDPGLSLFLRNIHATHAATAPAHAMMKRPTAILRTYGIFLLFAHAFRIARTRQRGVVTDNGAAVQVINTGVHQHH